MILSKAVLSSGGLSTAFLPPSPYEHHPNISDPILVLNFLSQMYFVYA
uniref:Uncharacterized protein n=1 Tax=Populus trichocarpa TaxID=3694 RepID=A9PGM1_POPTR|nr:unknown [Populus trichocarpa]